MRACDLSTRIIALIIMAVVSVSLGADRASCQEGPQGAGAAVQPASAAQAAAAELRVSFLGHRSYPSFTRLVFDTGGASPESFKINYDEAGGRVVFYPPQGTLAMTFSPVGIKDGAVMDVDYVQEPSSSTLGIVVRLGREALGLRVAYLYEPDRLVLDIYRKTSARPFLPLYREVRTVAVDPGHGGAHVGASSPDGLMEKDITLDVALKLRDALVKQGFKVVLTRPGDDDPPPDARAGAANNARADLYVALHASGSFGGTGLGVTVFTVDEGELGSRAVPEGSMVWEDQQMPYLPDSLRLARRLTDSLTGQYAQQAIRPSMRQSRLAGLSGLAMPAVLVEMGELSDPAQARSLSSDAFRTELALRVARGITEYAKGVSR